jgi:uncharacterized membrane protein
MTASRARTVRLLLLASASSWSCALLVSVLLRQPSAGELGIQPLADVIYVVGRVVCHQRPERSFHMASIAWPVCARCTGIYFGAVAGAWLAAFESRRLPWATFVDRARVGLALAALPTAATLVIEWTTASPVSNVWRASTAIPLGATLAWVLSVAASSPTSSVEVH